MVLLGRNLVEDQGNCGEEDWTGNRPEGRLPIVFQHWLNEGEDNPNDQDDLNEPYQDVGPEPVLEDHERPIEVLLSLEEWEGPNQEQVWEAG